MFKDRQRLTLPGVILVPSALVGLTSLFGMGRGDPHRYSHLKVLSLEFLVFEFMVMRALLWTMDYWLWTFKIVDM